MADGFFSREAGQQRRQWLDDQFSPLAEAFRYYLGAGTGLPERVNAVNEVLNPVVGIEDAMIHGREFGDTGDATHLIPMITEVAGAVAPVAAQKIAGGTADDLVSAFTDSLAGVSTPSPGAQMTLDAIAARANQPGPVPVMGSNFGNTGKPTRSTELPNLRGRDVDEAIRIARRNPHLIEAGEGSEGLYVGGPRNIQTRQDLTNQRRASDVQVGRGAEGGDWYDRYREGVTEVTSDPREAEWMAKLGGQYSAGVSPEGELAFNLRDTNSGLATGTPEVARFSAQRDATVRALEAQDPNLLQLGEKTGEYGRRVDPATAAERTATGVNDFRHARTLGFTEPDGTPQTGALGAASHRYSDYETALMVDRANKKNLAGRSDWTGEQIQAAPWVAQKADDYFDRQMNSYLKKAVERMRASGANDLSEEAIERVGRQIAFEEANRTITDFFPKHTAYGTYEAQPYIGSGQLPGLADATPAERFEFANDPRSSWTDETGRDVLYSGYRVPDTGYAMRVRPSVETQGIYTPPGGETEFNPGMAARPLVAFETTKAGHRLPAEDRALLDAAEATRAYIDTQGAGAWHKFHDDKVTKAADRNAVRFQFPETRPRTEEELAAIEATGARYNIPNVIDTGDGVTVTNFDPEATGAPTLDSRSLKKLAQDFQTAGIEGAPQVGRIDSGYQGYEGAWERPIGSQAVTKRFLETMDEVPEATYTKLNDNAAIPRVALERAARNEEYAARYGLNRADIQNALQIIGEGPGWIDRLKQAVASGAILPAVGAFVMDEAQKPENLDRPSDDTTLPTS